MHHREARPGARHVRRRAPRARAGGALATLFLAVLVAGPSPSSAAASYDPSSSQMRGRAHGGTVDLKLPDGLGNVAVGEMAPQSLPCNPTLGFEHVREDDDGVSSQVNFLGSITVPDPDDGVILRATAVRNSGGATTDASHAEVHERSRLADVFLLGGMVTAQAVQADAHTHLDATGTSNRTEGYAADPDHGSGTTVYDLRVDGEPVLPGNSVQHPPPNTEVPLPEALRPVLRIVLNEQKPFYRWVTQADGSKVRTLEGINVNAMHVYVLDHQGYRGDIVLAHASTRLAAAPARISGYAYGSRGNAGDFAASGKTALLGMPCGGTKGKVLTRSVEGADVRAPDGTVLLQQGTLTSTVQGLVDPDGSYSRTSSTVEQVDLLRRPDQPSVLQAGLIRTTAETSSGSPPGREGTMSFVDLVVNGERMTDDQVPPNTTVRVPGLGRVVLNHQMCANAMDDPATTGVDEGASNSDKCRDDRTGLEYLSLTVVGVHVYVEEPNSLGLPVGSQVLLAVSHADLFTPARTA